MDITSEEEDFQKPKRTSKPENRKMRPTQITNKYGVLENKDGKEQDQTPPTQQMKKNWVPPIVINTE